jgi:hypothetical protein
MPQILSTNRPVQVLTPQALPAQVDQPPIKKTQKAVVKDGFEASIEDTLSKIMKAYMSRHFDEERLHKVENKHMRKMFNDTDVLMMQRSKCHRADWKTLVGVLQQKKDTFAKRDKGFLTRAQTEKTYQSKIHQRFDWYIALASSIVDKKVDVAIIAKAHPLQQLGTVNAMRVFIADLEVLMRLGEASCEPKHWAQLRQYLAAAVEQLIRPIADQPLNKIKDILEDGIECVPSKQKDVAYLWGDAFNLARTLKNWAGKSHGRFDAFLTWDRRERPYDW